MVIKTTWTSNLKWNNFLTKHNVYRNAKRCFNIFAWMTSIESLGSYSVFELWYNTNNVLDCIYNSNLTVFYETVKYKKVFKGVKNEKHVFPSWLNITLTYFCCFPVVTDFVYQWDNNSGTPESRGAPTVNGCLLCWLLPICAEKTSVKGPEKTLTNCADISVHATKPCWDSQLPLEKKTGWGEVTWHPSLLEIANRAEDLQMHYKDWHLIIVHFNLFICKW